MIPAQASRLCIIRFEALGVFLYRAAVFPQLTTCAISDMSIIARTERAAAHEAHVRTDEDFRYMIISNRVVFLAHAYHNGYNE